MKAGKKNKILISQIFAGVLVFGYTLSSFATCNSILSGDLTEALWEEAFEAEKNLYTLRLSAEALFREFLNQEEIKFNFTDEKGSEVSLENFDIATFKELVVSLSSTVSDFHHFGISMPVPTQSTGAGSTGSIEELASKVSEQLSVETVMSLAQTVAANALSNVEAQIPQVFSQLRATIEENYVPLHMEFKKKGFTHEALNNMRATYSEINNYSARLIYSVKHGKMGIGFL